MSIVEEFLLDFEQQEADNDMHFSIYFVPSYYQPEELIKETSYGNT